MAIKNENESSKLLNSQANNNPNYLKFIGSLLLIFIGLIGILITFPLILLGGTLGLMVGLIVEKGLFRSGLLGVKIGSLGSISMILYGFNLINTNNSVEEPIQLVLENAKIIDELDNDPAEKESPDRFNDELNDRTEKPLPIKKDPTISPNFFAKATTESQLAGAEIDKTRFLDASWAIVNEKIIQEEKQIQQELEEIEDSPSVDELYIETLIQITKNTSLPENEFWDRLKQMRAKDLQSFIRKLSTRKEANFKASELDNLWRRFSGVEFEPTKRENKKNLFAKMLSALSEEQVKVSFDSPNFLNVLNKDEYVEVAANTLNRNQLELFASNIKRQDILNSLIKKLKPNPKTLGKLASLIPFANNLIKDALLQQIAHLPYTASFNINLAKLAQHYIDINNKKSARLNLPRANSAPSKWTGVHAGASRKNNALVIQKKDLAESAFEDFIQKLAAENYILYEQEIVETLSYLLDYRIKIIVERASLEGLDSLLKHLWNIEAKTINQKSFLDSRENRLKIILEHMSEFQLKNSLIESKFWEIFRNTQTGFCQLAANTLSPLQFETIIANTSIESHSDFALIISHINRDNQAEKERLRCIIKVILPYTTPWFVLALERKILSIKSYDKDLYNDLNSDLRKYLSQSMQNNVVRSGYARDKNLDKKAIGNLLIDFQKVRSELVDETSRRFSLG
jgi:hypothetical protein